MMWQGEGCRRWGSKGSVEQMGLQGEMLEMGWQREKRGRVGRGGRKKMAIKDSNTLCLKRHNSYKKHVNTGYT